MFMLTANLHWKILFPLLTFVWFVLPINYKPQKDYKSKKSFQQSKTCVNQITFDGVLFSNDFSLQEGARNLKVLTQQGNLWSVAF